MKLKLTLCMLAITCMVGAYAQMQVWQNGISHNFEISTIDSITFKSAEGPLTTYTITVRFPDCGFEAPTIVGEFNNWNPTSHPMTVVDATNHVYSTIVTADPSSEFKFAGATSGWNNQILLYVNAGEWDQFQQTFSSVATDSIIDLDYSDPVYYKWSLCEQGGDPFLNNLKFTGLYHWLYDTAYYGNSFDSIRDIHGQRYNVKLIQCGVLAFSEGFYLDNNLSYAGAEEGATIEMYAPIYWAPKWANPTQSSSMIFLSGQWLVTDSLMDRTMQPGSTNASFLSNMRLYVSYIQTGDIATAYQYLEAAGEQGCGGAKMYRWKYHTIEEGYPESGYYTDYLPGFFLQSGYFNVEYNYPTMNPAASNYMESITSHHLTTQALLNTGVDVNNNFYHNGCHLHYDESSDSYTWVDQHVHYDLPVVYDYNIETGSNAPSRIEEVQYIGISNFGDMETTKKIQNAIKGLPRDTNTNQTSNNLKQ